LQRVSPGLQAAALHVPVAAMQRAALAQAMPMFVNPVWLALHVCGWAPLQRVWPGVQAGAVQVPFVHNASEAQAAPLFWKPVRSGLQTWGWAPLQRASPVAHAGVLQVPFAMLQRPGVTQVMGRS
jgi:hypothetical protein